MTGKRILVTGGAGFLGSHLCSALLNSGHSVICMDNLYTGSIGNIVNLLPNPKFEFRPVDVVCPSHFDVDEIYNMACPASPIHYQRDPIKTTRTIVLGALNMLDLAKGNKAKILQASTSEVYGDPLIHPQPETYFGNVNPVGIRSCYDEGKRCAESLFSDYHRMYGVDIRIARIFNTYGPFMDIDDGRVVSNFINQAIRGDEITIYGDGSQTRSFCYVKDTIAGLMLLMDASSIHSPVNIGSGFEFTMLQLAEMVIDKVGSRSKIVFQDLPSDDPKTRRPCPDKALNLLGWEASTTLCEGLDMTIEYFDRKHQKGTA